MRDLNISTSENKIGVNKQKKISPKRIFMIILVVVAISGICGSYYFYNKYKMLNADANVQAQQETNRFVGALSKLMELPQKETPTIATISDKTKLKDQIFFADAENGDVLFAYTTSMKAILYRPSTNKIINVAPISINQPQNVSAGVKNNTSAPVITKN